MSQDLTVGGAVMMSKFGESVTYTPLNGSARVITAVVDREPPAPAGSPVSEPRIEVTVYNDATTGISTAELNTGGDMLTAAWRIGGDEQARRIVGVVQQDSGMVTLEVR